VRGSVYRRGGGNWEYRFDLEPDALTGRRRYGTKTGFATRAEAEKALRLAIATQDRGRRVRPARRTVADFLDEWHAAVRPAVRATTWVNYRDYLDAYVLPLLGDTRLQDLTPVRLNLLYGRLLTDGRVRGAGGLAAKTVQNVHRMLHRALRDAVKWDYLGRNPAEDADAPKARRYKPDVWTPVQLGAFVRHVADDRHYALWLLAATTGLRRGELAGLRRGDIDFNTRRVSPTIPRVVVDGHARESEPKTDSGYRSLALDPLTNAALLAYCERWEDERRLLGHLSPLLFVSIQGRPLHPDTITSTFRRHVRAAGLPPIRLHDLRHSYATAALKAGVPAKVISERLGHANVAFTLQVYSHVLPGMDAEAANIVADLIMDERQSAHKSAHTAEEAAPETGLTWAKAQVSDGSGGRI